MADGFGQIEFGHGAFGHGWAETLPPPVPPVESYEHVFLNPNLGIDFLLDEDGDLIVGVDGDLMITDDGRTSLLQDIKNILETLPGNLFGHPDYGSGVGRLFGKEDRAEFKDMMIRSIEDALIYGIAVAPRLDPDSIIIDMIEAPKEYKIAFHISVVPIGSEWTNRLNLVWGMNAGPGDI